MLLFEVVRLVNTWLKNGRDGLNKNAPLTPAFFDAAEKELRKLDDVLGVIGIDAEDRDGEAGEDGERTEIGRLVEERDAARKAKNFARSDEIRDELLARGIVLEDTPQGTKWKRKLQ
jgi:cysteinyl-tRNA synthetase